MRTLLGTIAVAGAALLLAACNSNTANAPTGIAPAASGQMSTGRAAPLLGRQYAPNTQYACPPAGRGEAQCLALVRTDTVGGLRPDVAGYGPPDLQSAYKLPSGGGTGQTIAVVDAQDNPNAEADLGTYRAQFGLPACTTSNGCFQKLNQNGSMGNYPGGSTGWGVEIDLDIEMVSAACPNCHIMLVEANSQSFSDLGTAVDTAVSKGANAVSNSYQGGDYGDSYASHYNHPGVIILASAGDGGYENPGGFPSDQPTVVSVGGTSLRRGGGKRGWSETVWNGSGSGCTTSRTPKPSWQKDTKPGDCQYRTMNDIAAVGDPNTGPAEYDSYGGYGWFVIGGTSVSSPLLGGVYGLAGNESSLDAAKSLYQGTKKRRTDEYDIVSGVNGNCSPSYLCTAGKGYDGPSGNGTPKGIGAF